jgi:hypothetical protein
LYESRRSRRQSRSPHRFHYLDPRYKTSNSNTKSKHQQDKDTQNKHTPKNTTNTNNNAVTVGITLNTKSKPSTPKQQQSSSNTNNPGARTVMPMYGAAGSDDHHQMTKQKKRLEHRQRPEPTLATKPSNNHSHSHQSTKRTVHLLLLPSPLDSSDVGTASPPTCTVAEAVFVAAKGRRGRDKKKEEVIRSPRQKYIEEELIELEEDGDEERADTILEHNHDDSGYEDEEEHYDQEDNDRDELEEAEV